MKVKITNCECDLYQTLLNNSEAFSSTIRELKLAKERINQTLARLSSQAESKTLNFK